VARLLTAATSSGSNSGTAPTVISRHVTSLDTRETSPSPNSSTSPRYSITSLLCAVPLSLSYSERCHYQQPRVGSGVPRQEDCGGELRGHPKRLHASCIHRHTRRHSAPRLLRGVEIRQTNPHSATSPSSGRRCEWNIWLCTRVLICSQMMAFIPGPSTVDKVRFV
jgi:hypothetical protein